jgi:hypothetical protein
MEQMSLFDMYGKPDYHGSKDEIVRYDIEFRFENSIRLYKCECGSSPKEMFKSCHEYFVKCPSCSKQTKMFKHCYEAKQAWNKGETDGKAK